MSEHPVHAMVVITCRTLHGARRTVSALKRAVPGAHIRGAGLTGIFLLEAEGDPLELAWKINQECRRSIGRAVAGLAQVPSTLDSIRESALEVGAEHIGKDDTFCFRLHKRGAHSLEQETPRVENEIGKAIWLALRKKYGERPHVDLKDPDVTIMAEVLGGNTVVGILRKSWRGGVAHCDPEHPGAAAEMSVESA